MATYTKKFNLKKPDPADFVDVQDLNENFDKIEEAIEAEIQKHDADLRAHAPKRYVITQRERDPGKPGYGLGGGGEQTVVLDTGPYTGETEISVVVSGTEYDAKNMSANGDAAKDGTLIITNTEESNYGNT